MPLKSSLIRSLSIDSKSITSRDLDFEKDTFLVFLNARLRLIYMTNVLMRKISNCKISNILR